MHVSQHTQHATCVEARVQLLGVNVLLPWVLKLRLSDLHGECVLHPKPSPQPDVSSLD